MAQNFENIILAQGYVEVDQGAITGQVSRGAVVARTGDGVFTISLDAEIQARFENTCLFVTSGTVNALPTYAAGTAPVDYVVTFSDAPGTTPTDADPEFFCYTVTQITNQDVDPA